MIRYDLCVAWNWEYDAEFVMLLDVACRSYGLCLLQITPDNFEDLVERIFNHEITFRAFLDRASDTDERFVSIAQWANSHTVYCINPYEQASRTWDKATMHSAFINAGLHVPSTIILPSYEEQPVLPPLDLSPLGDSFTIKPSQGSGGEGVIKEATSMDQVLIARQEYPTDKYLLQAYVVPVQLGSRPAWFRILYCAERVFPCWWDTDSYIFTPLISSEEIRYNLHSLHNITVSIARLCELDLFSTEIALTSDDLFVVVDYVNDQIDLRLKSNAIDGVPDDIVHNIVERLASVVKAQHSRPPPWSGDTSS